MKIEAKQRLNASFTHGDEGNEPVQNTGGSGGVGALASVDDDSKDAVETELAHAQRGYEAARARSDEKAANAYAALIKTLTVADAPVTAEQGAGPMADTLEANDTSDFMNLTTSDPGNTPLEASFFTKDEARAAFRQYKAEAEAVAGRSLSTEELMALVVSSQEAVAGNPDSNEKPLDYEEWKKSGKPPRANPGFGKKGFATEQIEQDKKDDDKTEVTSSDDPEMESDVDDPIGDGEEFELLIDGDPSNAEPEVQELTHNDGGIQPPTDQPLLIDDVGVLETK